MTGLQRTLLGLSAGVMGLSVSWGVVAVAPASARIPLGTGAIWCGPIPTTIKFDPAWSDTGTGNVTAKVSFVVKGECRIGGTPPANPIPNVVTGRGKFTFPNGTCTSSNTTMVLVHGNLKVTYSPSLRPTYLIPDKQEGVDIGTGDMGTPITGFLDGGVVVKGSYSSPSRVGGINFDAWTFTGNCAAGISEVVTTGGGFLTE